MIVMKRSHLNFLRNNKQEKHDGKVNLRRQCEEEYTVANRIYQTKV